MELTGAVQQPKYPKGFFTLVFAESWDRFSFYGTHALLILFLINNYQFTDYTAYAFFGAYTALSYALLVIGGFLADYFLGLNKTIILGFISMIAGNLLLLIPGSTSLYLGLSLTVCGIGLFKGNITSLVGSLFTQKNACRESGYTLFYLGMNLGAVLGPLVYGLIASQLSWRFSFAISACGLSLSLAMYLMHFSLFQKIAPRPSRRLDQLPFLKIKATHASYVFILFMIILFAGLLCIPVFSNDMLGFFSILTTFLLYAVISRQQSLAHKRQMLGLIYITLLLVIFFAATLQTESSLTLFIDRNLDNHIFDWKIPAIIYSALMPFSIIILSPIFIRLWRQLARLNAEPSLTRKVIIGVILGSISFFVFSWVANNHTQISPAIVLLLIIFANFILGAGELCIMPPVMTIISKHAPSHLTGTLMGVWFMSSALAGPVGSYLSTAYLFFGIPENNHSFTYTFTITALTMLILSFFIYLSSSRLESLITGRSLPRRKKVHYGGGY